MSHRDPFLKAHLLKYAGCGSGKVSYLSNTICGKIIGMIGSRILAEEVARIKKSGIYGVSIDSSLEVMHRDQLGMKFRYLEGYEPVEKFVTFLPNVGYKGIEMFDALESFLEDNSIYLKDCRCQTYDNASNMSGKFNGLQALVKKRNRLARWIPCFAHSLNLVGTNAMNCSLESKKFFCLMKNMYVFFILTPTERYDLLIEKLKENLPFEISRILVPKRVYPTRWSSLNDSVLSVNQGYKGYQSALSELSPSNDEAIGLSE
ncbi:hypothetical protein QAD02_001923 [Eretmocerus hayati]|uniref:Uncharacterized protein n=1 Tax=Eretmocerus hayati TaxID=131215 RepID=A0ACC2NHR2_9HYME|nr:hypothetical protein QAD02_001923 [Eretmocerus hayati]